MYIFWAGRISQLMTSHTKTAHYWVWIHIDTASGMGGGPTRVVVNTAAFHARVRGSVPGLGGLKETKMFLPHPRVKISIVGSLRDQEVACSASDRQGANFESCVWRTASSQSSHHPQEVLLAQFSLYVHKGGLKPDSFHFCIGYMFHVSCICTSAELDFYSFQYARIDRVNKGWENARRWPGAVAVMAINSSSAPAFRQRWTGVPCWLWSVL